jgi:hypothetical protein
MTLANFNSNFNFQLRALQQAAECCGIVPSIPVPPEPICFYFGEYYSAPDNNFDNSTMNGNPFNTEIYTITGNASDSINISSYPIIYDIRFVWTLTNDINTLPSLPTAFNSFNDPINATWVQGGCRLTCFELLVPQTDVNFSLLYLGISSLVVLDRAGFGIIGWDISNPAIVSIIDSYWKSAFGSQVSVTSTPDINGDYIIRINNTYENFAPTWENQTLGSMFFTEVSC